VLIFVVLMMPDVLHRTAWKEMRRRGATRHGGDGRAEGDESDEAEGREVDVDERVLNDVEGNVEKEGRGKAGQTDAGGEGIPSCSPSALV
jgi:hypothetical protein